MRPQLMPEGSPPLIVGALFVSALLLTGPAYGKNVATAGCPSPEACRSSLVARPEARPEPRPERDAHEDGLIDDRAERVSRRSIGDLGRGKASSAAVQATSDPPAALPLTLRPAAGPTLRWPPDDETPPPAPSPAPTALAIPLLPLAGAPGTASTHSTPSAALGPPGPSGQLAQRSASREPSGAEADVWFPDTARRPPPVPYNRPPDYVTKRPPDHYRAHEDVNRRPSDHSRASDDVSRRPPGLHISSEDAQRWPGDHNGAHDDHGRRSSDGVSWRPVDHLWTTDDPGKRPVEPYKATADESSGRPAYRPHGYFTTKRTHEVSTKRSFHRYSEHTTRQRNASSVVEYTTRRPSFQHNYRPVEAASWGPSTTRRPSDNSYYNGDSFSPGKLTGNRQQTTKYRVPEANSGNISLRPTPPANRWSSARPGGRVGSISRRKCSEYARLQTEKVEALPLVPEPKPLVQHIQKCDANSVPLVVGGQEARLNEFPHMAAIGYRAPGPKIEWNCGGSLISELFVLTAAHCTATAQGPPIRVRLGEHNLESSEDGAHPVDVAVSSMVRHPDYLPPARYHDIGLLRLARRVTLTPSVRPACLHTEEGNDDDDVLGTEPLIAVGWGHTEQLGERSQVLQKVILDFIDHSTCKSLYAADATTSSLSRGIVAESQLCAGVLEGGKDTCQGDSGGPLQMMSRDNRCVFHIVGITSFGKVCAARNAPGVYTRVSRFIPWIEQHVWPEERRD